MDVDLAVEGDRDPVPAGVDLAGYRLVQEALTNVLKHAGRVHATIAVRYADDELCIEVIDDGEGQSEDDGSEMFGQAGRLVQAPDGSQLSFMGMSTLNAGALCAALGP
jgi:signal transduction histidine kinase